MTKTVPVKKGSAKLAAAIRAVERDGFFYHHKSAYKVVDARPRTDDFVDLVLSDVY